jgi:hypothetical protein
MMDRNRYQRRPIDRRMAVNAAAGDNCLCVSQPVALAMSYVKKQVMSQTYPLAEGWRRGTIFPELDLPYCGGGRR